MDDGGSAAQVADTRRLRLRLRLGKSLLPLFAGLTAALLGLALVITQTVVAQRDARTRAMNEGDTLLALNALLSATLNGETGQRGYLLSGKTEYLAPYSDAKQRRDRALRRLREIAAITGDRDFGYDLDRLGKMTDAKFDEMDRSVALAQAGFKDQALALVQADFGRMQMEAIRAEITRLGLEKAARRRVAFVRAETLEKRLLPLTGVLSLAILALIYAGLRAERSRSLAEGEAEQAAALRAANERAELLARELNHRVKNLFAVILSIVALSARKPASSKELVEDIRARIRALSLAHSASQGAHGAERVELGRVVAKTMEPYADEAGGRVRIHGPDIELPSSMVTPLGLIVHELATNAVKYGALSAEEGYVDIAWEDDRDPNGKAMLMLTWREQGGPAIVSPDSVARSGFGSQMTTLAAGQLGGTLEREWPASGAVARLRFPLPG